MSMNEEKRYYDPEYCKWLENMYATMPGAALDPHSFYRNMMLVGKKTAREARAKRAEGETGAS